MRTSCKCAIDDYFSYQVCWNWTRSIKNISWSATAKDVFSPTTVLVSTWLHYFWAYGWTTKEKYLFKAIERYQHQQHNGLHCICIKLGNPALTQRCTLKQLKPNKEQRTNKKTPNTSPTSFFLSAGFALRLNILFSYNSCFNLPQ